ncbi:MAG: ferrous iron transport protein A [Hydrococcus sp. RU_2_2]|nr:ferrous iron transport protein A [Hydrococcus sp. RU_2_2]NJP21194.1 ferrous iron transport protein A [Hydrococcus sp. CRU_1_1]NJQ98249.1 ferrous iron transport protein A [Hydrococcus sp. CSU_1_8]
MFAQKMTLTGSSLSLLRVGERGTIISIQNTDDRTAGKLRSMGLSPGASFKLKQRSPSFTIEVGNRSLQLDDKMQRSLYVRII